MGNSESRYRPYICLLKQLSKKGGVKVSEKKLEELLKVIETHCTWFPELGTIDLDQWEAVGKDLTKRQLKGEEIPATIWETWKRVRSVLEPLQTDTEEEEEDKKQDCKSPIELSKNEESEEESVEAPTVIPKAIYPSLKDDILTPDSLPPPQTTKMKDWRLSKKSSKLKQTVSSVVSAPLPYAQVRIHHCQLYKKEFNRQG